MPGEQLNELIDKDQSFSDFPLITGFALKEKAASEYFDSSELTNAPNIKDDSYYSQLEIYDRPVVFDQNEYKFLDNNNHSYDISLVKESKSESLRIEPVSKIENSEVKTDRSTCCNNDVKDFYWDKNWDNFADKTILKGLNNSSEDLNKTEQISFNFFDLSKETNEKTLNSQPIQQLGRFSSSTEEKQFTFKEINYSQEIRTEKRFSEEIGVYDGKIAKVLDVNQTIELSNSKNIESKDSDFHKTTLCTPSSYRSDRNTSMYSLQNQKTSQADTDIHSFNSKNNYLDQEKDIFYSVQTPGAINGFARNCLYVRPNSSICSESNVFSYHYSNQKHLAEDNRHACFNTNVTNLNNFSNNLLEWDLIPYVSPKTTHLVQRCSENTQGHGDANFLFKYVAESSMDPFIYNNLCPENERQVHNKSNDHPYRSIDNTENIHKQANKNYLSYLWKQKSHCLNSYKQKAMNLESVLGCIHTEDDCKRLVEDVYSGRVAMVKRRINEKEKSLIRPGSIFIYNETESGIRRWTDKRQWSPSRLSGPFLVYKELAGSLYKKTYTIKLSSEVYHIIAYSSALWEEKGVCCNIFTKPLFNSQSKDLRSVNDDRENLRNFMSDDQVNKKNYNQLSRLDKNSMDNNRKRSDSQERDNL